MNETDISINEISPIIPNELFKIITLEFNNLLKKICDENNLNQEIITDKYSSEISKLGSKFGIKKRNRRKLPGDLQCMGRKLDGKQCTRGKRDTSDFCKSHANKLPFGRFDEPFKGKELNKRGRKKKEKNDNCIATYMKVIDGKNYLMDDNNFIYSFNINNPEFLGVFENDSIRPIEA